MLLSKKCKKSCKVSCYTRHEKKMYVVMQEVKKIICEYSKKLSRPNDSWYRKKNASVTFLLSLTAFWYIKYFGWCTTWKATPRWRNVMKGNELLCF